MKSLKILTGAVGIMIAGVWALPAQADMASGAVLTYTCFSCHGTDGESTGGMPTIAGKSEGYISGMLKDFKQDKHSATVMNRIAKGFSDDEIETIAKFFTQNNK